MSKMSGTIGVCTHPPVPLSFWRKQIYMQALYYPLLQTGNERTNEESNEIFRTKNAAISPYSSIRPSLERIYYSIEII